MAVGFDWSRCGEAGHFVQENGAAVGGFERPMRAVRAFGGKRRARAE